MVRQPSDPPRTPLEKLQLESGMNQTEFADFVGMDRPVVNQYLSGERSLGEKNAKRFATAMGEPEAWRELVTARSRDHQRSLEARLLELEERAAEREAEYQAQARGVADLNAEAKRLGELIDGLTLRVERLEGGASRKRGSP